MALELGSRVGPYQVIAEIGAGGMGVVYRAHDSRLGRDVALKVSAERFSERFEREARAVAALNHPNICTLHDVGPDYLVMELVEGETLTEVLGQRPRSSPGMPLDETLRIARQIASALEAAHDKGVVHRDLKPGNIKVKADGTVKVLDFGLAKIDGVLDGPHASGGEQLTQSPTVVATQVGLILGTAAYMAPEQARGKPVDKRADIWAFGVVVYEMLTGRRPFEGEDVSTTIAAVIQAEPRWDRVPRQLQRLLKKCLEKDPRRRLRDIGDVWELRDEVLEASLQQSRFGSFGWVAAGALTIVAAIALWAPWRAPVQPDERPLVRLEIDLGSEVSLPTMVAPTPSSVAISPDATRFVYVASVSGGPPQLYIRRLDQPTATALAGTEGGNFPFFSPDGKWVAFHDRRGIKKIPVEGGAILPLMETTIFAGADWTEGDLIVGSGLGQGVLRSPSSGGAHTSILDPVREERFYASPQLLPGGKDLLVTVYGSPPSLDRAFVDVVSLADRSRKTIVRGGTAARYLPSGHLVYTNRSTMFAVPFDLDARETRGTAVPVLNEVAYDPAAGMPQFAISRDGTLVYRRHTASGSGAGSLAWVGATGNPRALQPKPAQYAGTARLSPDGKKVSVVIRDGASQDLWVYDIERDAMTRLTYGTEAFASAVWSRDGRYIVFGSIGNGLFWVRADGGGQPQQFVASKSIAFPFSFSPDGTRLAYYEVMGTSQIWTVPIEQGDGLKAGKPERYLTSQFADSVPMFSPDGRWLAYESNESGRPEVYVRAFPARSGKWQISNSGGTWPIWSPNARELLYRSGDQLMSVAYTTTRDSFAPEKPKVWLPTIGNAQSFDLAPDGTRVLVVTSPPGAAAPKPEHTLMFVQNFFDELRRRVPIAK
jgi:Tol biopolymer transport system component/predicted Ser/Thr protein kinase